jgi:hypothetical protein
LTVKGTATDNVGVTAVTIKLYRDRSRNGVVVREIWNGTSFGTTSINMPTTLGGIATSRTWKFDTNIPTSDKLDEGVYYLIAYANDAAGKSSISTRINFTLFAPDTEKPVVAITAPTQSQKLATTAFISGAVKGTATDNVGVTGVTVKLYRNRGGVNQFWNGTNFGTTSALVTATRSGTTWTLTNMPPQAQLDSGTYSLVAYATDAQGNSGVSAVRSFTMSSDFTAPSISITNPVSASSVNINSFGAGIINGIAGDNIGVTSVQLKLVRKRVRNSVTVTEFWNGTSFSTTSALVNASVTTVGNPSVNWSYNTPIPASALDAGAYILYAYAYDAVGNSTASAIRNFNVSGSTAAASSAGDS